MSVVLTAAEKAALEVRIAKLNAEKKALAAQLKGSKAGSYRLSVEHAKYGKLVDVPAERYYYFRVGNVDHWVKETYPGLKVTEVK